MRHDKFFWGETFMAIVQLAISLLVLGILYRRMVRREPPPPISKAQALVPIVLGVLSLPLSFVFVLANANFFASMGYTKEAHSLLFRSVFSAFFTAGLPEEIAKFLMILLTLFIFRAKVRNVYEYILVGAAVGFGFTVFEEFIYGSGSIATSIMRDLLVTLHMLLGILMGKHLGLARYCKTTGKGSAAREYALALLVPILIHTLYDASVLNQYLETEDDNLLLIGLVIAVAALVILFVLQFVALIRLKRNAEKYSAMEF